MIAVLILIPVVGFALFTLVCYKTDWEDVVISLLFFES